MKEIEHLEYRNRPQESQPYGTTRYLTGLRGYAALWVFLIHIGGYGLRELGHVGQRFVDHGKYGVICFFVLSAFTLTLSWEKHPHSSYSRFLLRRLLRIAPLYYAASLLFWLLPEVPWIEGTVWQHTWRNLWMHLTFLNLFDVRYQTSLIGLEWTIPLEIGFYLFVPFCVILSRSFKGTLVLLGATLLFMATRYLFVFSPLPELADQISLQRYALCFIAGVLAYRARDLLPRKSWAFLLLVGAWLLHLQFGLGTPLLIYTLLTLWIILTSGGANRLSKIALENPLILYLGRISFSIYLLHPLVLRFGPRLLPSLAFKLLSLPLVILVASIGYWMIEHPFLRWSQRLKETPVQAELDSPQPAL